MVPILAHPNFKGKRKAYLALSNKSYYFIFYLLNFKLKIRL